MIANIFFSILLYYTLGQFFLHTSYSKKSMKFLFIHTELNISDKWQMSCSMFTLQHFSVITTKTMPKFNIGLVTIHRMKLIE